MGHRHSRNYSGEINNLRKKITELTSQISNMQNKNNQLLKNYDNLQREKELQNTNFNNELNKIKSEYESQNKKRIEEEEMKKKRILELQEEIFKLGEEEEKRLLDNLKEEFLNTKITWCYNKLDRMNINEYINIIFDIIILPLKQTLISYITGIINQLKNINNITILNVQIIGKTGVGKSCLINHLLFKKLAKEGLGECCTLETKSYINEEKYPFLKLYDTRGIELSKDYNIQKVLNDTTLNIKNKLELNDPSEIIHCLLYCLDGVRLEGVERELLIKIRKMYNGERLPIIIVNTRAIKKGVNQFKKKINILLKETFNEEISNEPEKISFIPVLSKKEELIDGTILYPYGLDDLIESCIIKAEHSIHSACINSLQYTAFSRIKKNMENISFELMKQKEDFINNKSNGKTYNLNNKSDLLNEIFNHIIMNYLELSGLIFENPDYSNTYKEIEPQIKEYINEISDNVNVIEKQEFENYETINLKEIKQKLHNFECEKIIEKELNECFNVLKNSSELNEILKADFEDCIKNLSVHNAIFNSASIFYDKINNIILTSLNDLFHKIIFENEEIKIYISDVIGNKFDDNLKNNLNKLKEDLKAYQDNREKEDEKQNDEESDDNDDDN